MKKVFILIALFTICMIGHAQSGSSKNGPNPVAKSAKTVKVFPNPASNVVNVLGLENTAKADISVLDIYGNTMLGYQWAIRRNAVNIPISNLKKGAYIILIHSNAQRIRTKFYKK